MLLAFCYKQEKSVAMRNKANVNKDGISTELAVYVDNKKRNKKENNK